MSKNGIRNPKSLSGGKARKLEVELRQRLGKNWSGASSTRGGELTKVSVIARQMARYGVNSVDGIRTKHVMRLFADLAAGKHTVLTKDGEAKVSGKALESGTLGNYATVMRDIAEALHKPQIVPDNKDLDAHRDKSERTKHAGKAVNEEKWLEIESKVKPWQAAALAMVRAFGLREAEALRSFRLVTRDGVQYLVIEGAKGGRANEKPLLTQEQFDAHAKMMEFRNAHGGTLAPPDKTFEQAKTSLSNAVAYRGGSIENGCNLHAGRRQELIDKLERAVSAYAIHGDRDAYRAELQSIAQYAGHGRTEVLESYCKLLK